MAGINVYGLGHALVDVALPARDELFEEIQLPKGRSLLMTPEQQHRVVAAAQVDERLIQFTAGGFVANSLAALSQLSGVAAFSGRIGGDELGELYKKDFENLRIELGNPTIVGGNTGRSVVLLSPGGVHTTGTYYGVSEDFNPMDVNPELIKQCKWLFIEGYLVDNGKYSLEAVLAALRYVKGLPEAERPKVAVALCGRHLVKGCRDSFIKIMADSDLAFGRMGEVEELTGAANQTAAFQRLERMVPSFVITAGDGAFFSYEKQYGHEPASSATPLDGPGAAEVFAGAFLYGVTNGCSARNAVRGANYLASRVIQQRAFRLRGDAREEWKEAMSRP